MNTQPNTKSSLKQTKTIKYRKVLNELYKKGSISEKKYKKEELSKRMLEKSRSGHVTEDEYRKIKDQIEKMVQKIEK